MVNLVRDIYWYNFVKNIIFDKIGDCNVQLLHGLYTIDL